MGAHFDLVLLYALMKPIILLGKYWAVRKQRGLSAGVISVGVCCCLAPLHYTHNPLCLSSADPLVQGDSRCFSPPPTFSSLISLSSAHTETWTGHVYKHTLYTPLYKCVANCVSPRQKESIRTANGILRQWMFSPYWLWFEAVYTLISIGQFDSVPLHLFCLFSHCII